VRHHRAVPRDLHLDPDLLRAVAAGVEDVLPGLHTAGLDPADLAALARAPGGAALVAEHDRLAAAAAGTGGELAALVAALRATADGVASAEHRAVRAMTAVDR
jgi:hypothetical protein